MDYASMVQPILDKHCVACHGGEEGIACGLDLSGGWTEFFSISYENLTSRREVQYKSTLIAGIDCMNGTALYSSQILPPYSHGSSAAPLAKVLVEGDLGHQDRLPDMTRAERDLLLAWIDSNGLFNGTWDYTQQGCRLAGWKETKTRLIAEMRAADCTQCHDTNRFEADWFNLERPEMSRILRAPLAKSDAGFGLGLCRQRKVDASFRRLRIMSTGRYQHAVMPLDAFPRQEWKEWDESGAPVVPLTSVDDPAYQSMLGVIRTGRARALAAPRVDMPGAMPIAGESRCIYPIPIPKPLPAVTLRQHPGGEVELSWPRNTHTWGLAFDIYRGTASDFVMEPASHIATTKLCRHIDSDDLEPGDVYYAVVFTNGDRRSAPVRSRINIRPVPPPAQVTSLVAKPGPGTVCLSWMPLAVRGVRYTILAADQGNNDFRTLCSEPIDGCEFVDVTFPAREVAAASSPAPSARRYRIQAIDRRGVAGPLSDTVEAAPKPVPYDPVFQPSGDTPDAMTHDGNRLRAAIKKPAKYTVGEFDFTQGGHATYPRQDVLNLGHGAGLTVECSVCLAAKTQMPVVISAGRWRQAGWFLQQIGGRWRWHVGGVDCDGGAQPPLGQWTHLRAVWDGTRSKLFQDGRLVADVACPADLAPWNGPLLIGQYSGSPAPQYQTRGRVKDVKIYIRPIVD
jgi:hypothetical protein